MNAAHLPTASYPCPVCAETRTRLRYEVAGFSIVSCTGCGMVYVNPRIQTEELFNIYRNEYFHRGGETEGSGYENYELTSSLRIKTFTTWYADLKKYLPQNPGNARALDIGCAAGYFLDLLRANDWKQVEGIELDTTMLAGLKARGLEVSNLPLEQFEPGSRQYQLITLFDVLEHLPDINNDFIKMRTMLSDNGIIALVTPDFGSFQRKLFGRRWFQFKPCEHIYYFSRSSLEQLAQKHGFKLLHCAPSGQFADYAFLHDRLSKYRFPLFRTLFSTACRIMGLTKNYWYMNTGSLFAVLTKN